MRPPQASPANVQAVALPHSITTSPSPPPGTLPRLTATSGSRACGRPATRNAGQRLRTACSQGHGVAPQDTELDGQGPLLPPDPGKCLVRGKWSTPFKKLPVWCHANTFTLHALEDNFLKEVRGFFNCFGGFLCPLRN